MTSHTEASHQSCFFQRPKASTSLTDPLLVEQEAEPLLLEQVEESLLLE